jgi:TP901 family phage tail tape measure protein
VTVARTVSVKLMADVTDYRRKMQGAAADARGLMGDLDKANQAGKLDNVTHAAAGLGLGLVGVAGAAIKMNADFDKQMSGVQAATHATAGDMNRLRQAALDAGADTKFSATSAAEGIEELSKAGIATSDILNGGLNGALSLAAAGSLDVGEAAETAASAMTQFKLKGSDVPHIADLLAAAAGKAQGSVHDMGAALNQAGLVSAQMGNTVEETTGTLAAFASAGLMGSDAGTSLKTSLLMLANPTEKSSGLMQELGINAYDAQGKFVGMSALAGQLQTQLGGLTQEQRNSALATIFGSDAIRAASVLYDQGAAGIDAWTKKVDDQGYAAETARLKTDNLAGDVERLTGSLQTLAIESGSGANGGLRILAQGAEALVDQFGRLPPVIGSTITVGAALTGGALLLGAGMLRVRRSTAEMLTELRSVGPAGERAATAFEKTRKGATIAATAFVALQVASASVAAMQDELTPQVEALAKGLADYGVSGNLAGESSRLLGKDLEDLEGGFKFLADEDNKRRAAVKSMQSGFESLIPGLAGTNESLARTKQRITAMDQALTQLVQAGQADQAKAAFDRLAQSLAVNGVSMEEFKKQFPQYAAAVEVAGSASKTAAKGIDAVGVSAGAAADEIEEMTQRFDDLFEAQMSIDRANLEVRTGMVELTKELKTGSRTLSLNTEEGRTNRSAVLDQIEAIEKLRLSRLKHGDSLDSANKKYVRDIDGLRRSMLQAGFAKDEVNRLTGAYRKLPDEASTKVVATGVPATRKQLADLVVLQQALRKGVSMGTARALAGDAAAARDRNLFDAGGWTGPGDTHDEAGVVHADEYVLRKAARRPLEDEKPGALDYMNRTGRWPEYDGGGRVAWPYPTTAGMTRIPSRKEASDVVTPELPSGGRTSDFIVRVVRQAFPGMAVLSKDRPGSITLTGNRSYHSMGRAVDFPASRPLAEWWNLHYKARTKEFISPWNDLNIHNGQRHTYTGAVYRQHNFAGGNAHDHIAMANGGVINEPVYGVGASGRSYSFGERGISETVLPGTPRYLPPSAGPAPITVVVQGGDGADMAQATAVLQNILAATLGVGGDVAAAMAGRSAAITQVSRSWGRVTPR